MIVDFHSHTLPGIDDGSKNTVISIEMLKKELADGVDICVATPHYYCDEQSIETFLDNREAAFNDLLKASWNINLPIIKLGAEVYYSPVLKNMDNLHELCIEGTDFLLLELPYSSVTTQVVSDIQEIIDKHHITPIMAHIERFLKYNSYSTLAQIMELDVLGQVNCGSLLNFSSKRNAFRFMNDGYIHLLGSDAHNTDSRPPRMKEAFKVICAKFGRSYLDALMHNSSQVLHNESVYNIL